MKLEKNMGTVDRIIRLIVAILFGYLYFSGLVTGALGIILLVVGVVFLLTSLFAICPLYLPFKFSTLRK
jgi:uncharacterized membrane protein YtjA (UPF0391 family)